MLLLTINANFAESKSFWSPKMPKLKRWTPKTAKAEALDSKNAKAKALDSNFKLASLYYKVMYEKTWHILYLLINW
jgi:hypothetical protein